MTLKDWEPDDEVSKTIFDFIENLRAEQRLYPDLYANQLAKEILKITKNN